MIVRHWIRLFPFSWLLIAWHLEPLADRRVGIALRAPSPALLRSPISRRCSGAGIHSPHTLPSSFLWGSLRFFPSNKGSGRTWGFLRLGPSARRAPPPSRESSASPFPASFGGSSLAPNTPEQKISTFSSAFNGSRKLTKSQPALPSRSSPLFPGNQNKPGKAAKQNQTQAPRL